MESGRHKIVLALKDRGGTPLPPGEYEAVVRAYNGLDRVRSVPIAVTIPATPPPPPPPSDEPSSSPGPWLAIAAGIALAAAGVVLWRRMRQPKVNV
jgi:hypothetical protein